MSRATKCFDLRTLVVDGQAKWRGMSQQTFPCGEVSIERLALKPRALPRGKIGVLNGQRFQRVFCACEEGVVERRDFPNEDFNGPAVGGDVMEGAGQEILRWAESHEGDADENVTRKVEMRGQKIVQDLFLTGTLFGDIEAGQIDLLEWHGGVRQDPLVRLAIDRVEAGTQ